MLNYNTEDYAIGIFVILLVGLLILGIVEREHDTDACLKRGGIPKSTRYEGVICFAPETLR